MFQVTQSFEVIVDGGSASFQSLDQGTGHLSLYFPCTLGVWRFFAVACNWFLYHSDTVLVLSFVSCSPFWFLLCVLFAFRWWCSLLTHRQCSLFHHRVQKKSYPCFHALHVWQLQCTCPSVRLYLFSRSASLTSRCVKKVLWNCESHNITAAFDWVRGITWPQIFTWKGETRCVCSSFETSRRFLPGAFFGRNDTR